MPTSHFKLQIALVSLVFLEISVFVNLFPTKYGTVLWLPLSSLTLIRNGQNKNLVGKYLTLNLFFFCLKNSINSGALLVFDGSAAHVCRRKDFSTVF